MAYHAYRIYPSAAPAVTLRQIVCRDSEIAGQLAAGEAYEPVDFGQSAPEEPTPPDYASASQGAKADTALQPGDLALEVALWGGGASPSGKSSPAELAGYAPLDSPAFLNTPTAPTPPSGDTSNRISTTEFVKNVVSSATGDVRDHWLLG